MNKQKGKTSREMFLVRIYYSDPRDSYPDGKVPFNINGVQYLITEDKEVWVPREVIDACDGTMMDMIVQEIEEDTGRIRHKTTKRRRINYEIVKRKTVVDDADVAIEESSDREEIEIDGETIEL